MTTPPATAPDPALATGPADARPATLLSPHILVPFIIVTLVWGSTWLVIRNQLGVVPPSWSVTYRFAVAAVAMFALALARRERLWISARAQGYALLLGLCQFALNFNFVYRAEAFVTSGLVSVIFALLIIPNSLFSRVFLKTPVPRAFMAGAGIAAVGICLLLLHEVESVHGNMETVAFGAILTFCGVLSASASNVMQATTFGRAQSMFVILAWAMLWGASVDGLFALATVGPPVVDWRWGYMGGVLYLGLFGSVLSFPLYFGIIRAVGAGAAAWSSVLIPVIAMALSTLAEGYQWSGLSIAGAVLALAGLIVALRPSRPVAPPA
ncbi:MAG: DMT family transporter [Sphingopyxis sp.]